MTNATGRRWLAAALGALLCGASGTAGAESGNSVLESKTEGAVVMSGKAYHVDSSTVIESQEGNRLTLAELPTLAGGASADDAAVWFEASDSEAAPTAHLIKLTGAVPQ